MLLQVRAPWHNAWCFSHNETMRDPALAATPLATAVRQRAEERGLNLKEAAKAMGLTYTHLMALCSGGRRFSGVRRPKMLGVAEFLGLSVVHCYLLAGAFDPSDFVASKELGPRLRLSLSKMRADPEWGGFAPPQATWDGWPEEARLLVSLLYERAAGETTRQAARKRA